MNKWDIGLRVAETALNFVAKIVRSLRSDTDEDVDDVLDDTPAIDREWHRMKAAEEAKFGDS